MATEQLTKIRELARQLSFQEQVLLLNDLTTFLLQQSSILHTPTIPLPLPTIHLATWPDQLPLRREELYDDHGR